MAWANVVERVVMERQKIHQFFLALSLVRLPGSREEPHFFTLNLKLATSGAQLALSQTSVQFPLILWSRGQCTQVPV